MNKIKYKDFDVEFIYKAKLKNTYISVEINKKIIIKSSNQSNSFILNLLKERESWICKQIFKVKTYKVYDVNIEDEVLIFGELYSMDAPEAKNLRDKLHNLRVNNLDNIIRCYDGFYKSIAKEYLTQRVNDFARLMNLQFNEIKYRKMKSRWGSCSSKKILTFNSELMKIQEDLIDYVIVHELAHLVHMNHSSDFHNLVENYLKNSRLLRKNLKKIRLVF